MALAGRGSTTVSRTFISQLLCALGLDAASTRRLSGARALEVALNALKNKSSHQPFYGNQTFSDCELRIKVGKNCIASAAAETDDVIKGAQTPSSDSIMVTPASSGAKRTLESPLSNVSGKKARTYELKILHVSKVILAARSRYFLEIFKEWRDLTNKRTLELEVDSEQACQDLMDLIKLIREDDAYFLAAWSIIARHGVSYLILDGKLLGYARLLRIMLIAEEFEVGDAVREIALELLRDLSAADARLCFQLVPASLQDRHFFRDLLDKAGDVLAREFANIETWFTDSKDCHDPPVTRLIHQDGMSADLHEHVEKGTDRADERETVQQQAELDAFDKALPQLTPAIQSLPLRALIFVLQSNDLSLHSEAATFAVVCAWLRDQTKLSKSQKLEAFKTLLLVHRFHNMPSSFLGTTVYLSSWMKESGLLETITSRVLCYTQSRRALNTFKSRQQGSPSRGDSGIGWELPSVSSASFDASFDLTELLKLSSRESVSRCVGVRRGHPLVVRVTREAEADGQADTVSIGVDIVTNAIKASFPPVTSPSAAAVVDKLPPVGMLVQLTFTLAAAVSDVVLGPRVLLFDGTGPKGFNNCLWEDWEAAIKKGSPYIINDALQLFCTVRFLADSLTEGHEGGARGEECEQDDHDDDDDEDSEADGCSAFSTTPRHSTTEAEDILQTQD